MKTMKQFEKQLSLGKMSRRDFLLQASALGITVAAGSLSWPETVQAAVPKRGGRFRLGMAGGATGDNLNPVLATDEFTYAIATQLRNSLVEFDHNSQLVPELAESWEPSADGKQWTFNLRKSIEFHNGKTMDAEDVVFSLNLHRGKDSKSVMKSYFSDLKDIRTDGKYRVIMTLNSANADFPTFLAKPQAAILPAGTTDFNAGIGTGGYILKEFEPGVRSFTVRNPNYWKPNCANFDEIEILGIADVNARTSALKSGTIDAMNRCELKTVKLLDRMADIQIIRTKGAKHYPFPMRTDVAPFDNNDVRLALKYAVDRELMVKTILRGYGSVGNDTPIGPSYQFFNTELPQRAYDPDKARFHLKKAGMLDHTFTLNASDAAFTGAVDAAMIYQESAKKAGLKIKVVREPNDGYWSNVWMKKNWTQSYYSGTATEREMFFQAYAADSKWNETFWHNKRFNSLLKESGAELNTSKRRDMIWEMQRIMWEQGGTVIPIFTDFVDAASSKVKFGKLTSIYALDGFKCCEKWWFDS